MLKTLVPFFPIAGQAYHLGEGRMLKTVHMKYLNGTKAYHLGEGRMLKTIERVNACKA